MGLFRAIVNKFQALVKVFGLREIVAVVVLVNLFYFMAKTMPLNETRHFKPKFISNPSEKANDTSKNNETSIENGHRHADFTVNDEKVEAADEKRFLDETKIVYFVTNEANPVGKKGVTLNREYFMQKCNVPCLVTNDKHYLGEGNIDKFDALIFKIRFFKTDQKASMAVPEKRSPHQRYILNTHESSRAENIPPFVNKNFMSTNFYNWTWNFRLDSDIIESYGPFLGKVGDPPPLDHFKSVEAPKGIITHTKMKSKIAFWTVSHCKTDNHREVFVQKLQQYLAVDVFGECSGVDCPRKLKESCFASQGPHYWFYLSFENSNCPDYVTEKLWRILDSAIVPIVMGGGNYSRIAPPHSVIDVNDYSSVEELAKYLVHLTENPDEYLEYFKWKKNYLMYYTDPYCTMCRKLHDVNEPVKIYENMTDWFYYGKNGKLLCTDGSERPYFQSLWSSSTHR